MAVRKSDTDAIKRVVRQTLADDFDNIDIIDIKVRKGLDFDGDEVLRIEIVFAGTPNDLDARKLSGAVRHLRPKLGEIDEYGFPLLSFISQAELKKVASA